MGNSFSVRTPDELNFNMPQSQPKEQPTEEKKKLKPCCACPETKKARDECIMKNGVKNCSSLIEAHLACMRSMGFEM